jgi:glycerol 2-dehydrogenase (NADP+)
MWGLQRGTSVIPKLTDEEVKEIDSLPERFKVCGDAWLPIKVFFGDDE